MEVLWNAWDMQTAFLALAVLLMFSTRFLRHGLHRVLTEWLGLTQSNATNLTRASIVAVWLVLLILLTIYRAGS